VTASEYRAIARGWSSDVDLAKACDLAADVLEPSEEIMEHLIAAHRAGPALNSRTVVYRVLTALAARLGAKP
jgi:hypothetical protein